MATYAVTKSPRGTEPLSTTEGAPGPPEASDVRDDDGGGPCAISNGAEAAAIVKSYWTAF